MFLDRGLYVEETYRISCTYGCNKKPNGSVKVKCQKYVFEGNEILSKNAE